MCNSFLCHHVVSSSSMSSIDLPNSNIYSIKLMVSAMDSGSRIRLGSRRNWVNVLCQ